MLKIALIGYGYWGSKLARNFQNLEIFNLMSIVDLYAKNLASAKKNYPIAKNHFDEKTQFVLRLKPYEFHSLIWLLTY